ncbi:alpha/beta family hydrolase [Marinomonas epiphytica]
MANLVKLSHGAGVGHLSESLRLLTTALRDHSFEVVPYTFDYMKEQELTGKKRPPNKFDSLVEEWQSNLIKEDDENYILAGKSMGGRVATQLTHLSSVKGVICFGFPFYPAGKQEKHRLSFLENMECPCLIIQGTRDTMGNFDWVNSQSLPKNVEVVWVDGADHDFKRLKKHNKSIEETMSELAITVHEWVKKTFK